jgi:hypothetical protein
MSSSRKVTRDVIKKNIHFLEQKDILIDNLLNISVNTIKILKETLLSDYDIQVNGMAKTLCNFFKFISANLCGITELSPILTAFFSFLANLIIPKKFNPFKLNEIHDLYENQLQEDKLKAKLGEYEPLDEKSIVTLRRNLITFMDKLITAYPNTSREIYPLCDVSKFITMKVCDTAYIFIPIIIFIRLLTHSIIPDKIAEAIVDSMKGPNNYTLDEYDEYEQGIQNIAKKQSTDTIETNIEPSAPPEKSIQPVYYDNDKPLYEYDKKPETVVIDKDSIEPSAPPEKSQNAGMKKKKKSSKVIYKSRK